MDTRSTLELAQILWDYNNLNQPPHPADCILVLGSNDIRMADWGAQLFLEGYAPWIIFSGNVGRLTEGMFAKPEAEAFADRAHELGVPWENILIESRSTNTGENIRFTQELLHEKALDFQSFILIQKPYMGRRAYATFRKYWPDMDVVVTAPPLTLETYPNDRLNMDTIINIMVGDTQRIREYPSLGYQIEQPMPSEVWEAYEELVRRGYTNHLIHS